MLNGEQSVKRIPNRRAVLRTHSSGVLLAPEEIDLFLEEMRAKGRVEGTLNWYRRGLHHLYKVLPEDKHIQRGTLASWREQLLESGYATRTVNLFISAANSFLEYKGLREYQLSEQLKPEDTLQPELTRAEYLRLLQTARTLGRERVYLLVKLFGSTGLQLQELSKVTVEAAREGRVTISPGGTKQVLHIPSFLCQELLAYADRCGRRSGPIFLTRDGVPMSRTNVSTGIRQLCVAAQVPEEKGNPRCLRKLYLATRAGIEANIALLVEQAHDRMMEQEQLTIGWEDEHG